MFAAAAAANSNGRPNDRLRRVLLRLRTTKTWENILDQPIEDVDCKNIMDPIRVRLTDVSFNVRFHYVFDGSDGEMLMAVEIADLKSSVDDLLIKSTLKVGKNYGFQFHDQCFDTTLAGEGPLGVAHYHSHMEFSVHLDVSAPPRPPRPACALGAELWRVLTEDGLGPRRTFYDVDVKLESADEGELAAHKLVLSARSPVFEKMLTDDMREARESRVALKDMSGNLLPAWLLKNFLQLLYTGTLAENSSSPEVGGGLVVALELMALAHRYQVDSLVAECTRLLWLHLDKSTAVELLSVLPLPPWINRAEADALTRAAVQLLYAHWDEVTSSASWADFARDQPENAAWLAGARPTHASTATVSDDSE